MFAESPDLPPDLRAPAGPAAERATPSTDGPTFNSAATDRPLESRVSFDGDERYQVVVGTSAADNLAGTDAWDHFIRDDGNDTLAGGAGGDILEGNAGDDVLTGGAGSDKLVGGSDNDQLDGGTTTMNSMAAPVPTRSS